MVNPAPAAPSATLHFVIYRSVPLSARDLVFDAKRNRLYASIDAGASAYANYFVSIDPNTGTVTPLINGGTEPSVLALTSDAQFLYAGVDGTSSIMRVNLDTGAIDETISLGSDPFFGAYRPEALATLPGAPNSIAVVKVISATTNSGGITIYDGTTPIGQAPLSNGVATLSVPSLSRGHHSITATYKGDNCFASSTSDKLDQEVLGISSSTALVSNNNPAKEGTKVNFTATVTPSVVGSSAE